MKLKDFYKSGRFGVSFELFPPKTPKGEKTLYEHVSKLMEFSPSLITCTYGAGGSTQGKTLDIIEKVKLAHAVPTASHLTCVGSSVADLREYLAEAEGRGVDYIVALRGDPPQGETKFKPNPNGLSYANELVSLIKDEFPEFGIAVAGYPEKHQEAPSMEVDIKNLKRKVDAGADIILTQLFFDNRDFYKFQEICDKAKINVPIIPGIFPIGSLQQIQKIAKMCAAKIPQVLLDELNKKPDDSQWHAKVGTHYASKQVEDLKKNGVAGLHLYVLNKSEATIEILNNNGLSPVKAR